MPLSDAAAARLNARYGDLHEEYAQRAAEARADGLDPDDMELKLDLAEALADARMDEEECG